jgi:hypothetical protein
MGKMRIVRAALILGLAASGCVSVRGAGAESNSIPSRPEGAPYPNWQHMCVLPGIGGSSDLLNEAGEQGWELVAVTEEGRFCFKRPMMPPGGAYPPPPGPPPPPGAGPPLGANPYAEHGPAPSDSSDDLRDPFASTPEAPAASAPAPSPDVVNPFSEAP